MGSSLQWRRLHDLDRYLRLQLSRVEGQLLSGGSSRGEDAWVLRRPLSDGRDQLHVLPDADREASGRMGRANAVPLQADAQGAAAHHAWQPIEELQGAG